MKRLRQSLLALLVGFSLFVNIVVAQSRIVESPAFPVLCLSIATCLVAMMLLLRPRRAALALAIAAAGPGYGAVRMATVTAAEMRLVEVLLLTAVEVALLVVLVLSSHRIAKAMREATNLIAHLTAGGQADAPASDPLSDPRVKREMTRSRRYQRPLSLVLLEPAERSLQDFWPDLLEEARNAFARRYLISKMFSHIGSQLRFVDLMYEDADRGRFLLLCPEARSEEIERQVERIRRSTLDATGVHLNAGWASFPDGAVTFAELMRTADAHLRTSSAARDPEVLTTGTIGHGAQPSFIKPEPG